MPNAQRQSRCYLSAGFWVKEGTRSIHTGFGLHVETRSQCSCVSFSGTECFWFPHPTQGFACNSQGVSQVYFLPKDFSRNLGVPSTQNSQFWTSWWFKHFIVVICVDRPSHWNLTCLLSSVISRHIYSTRRKGQYSSLFLIQKSSHNYLNTQRLL